MYRLLSIVLAVVMLALTSVAQAQDVVELSPSSTRVTQNFDDMWDAETGTAVPVAPAAILLGERLKDLWNK